MDDLRYVGESIEATFIGELTKARLQAMTIMARHDNGMIGAPPDFGKTVLGAYLIAER